VGAVIDGEGNVTRYHYTARGDLDQEIRGQQVTAATAFTLATLPAASGTVETRRLYRNAAGQLTSQVRTLVGGTETTAFAYDTRGRLVSQTIAESVSAETRTQRYRYDVKGRLLGEVSGVGAATLPASPTDAQLVTAINTYGTSYAYDAADRLIQKVTAPGSGATGDKTLYYYDTDGHLRFEINALGEVVEHIYSAIEDRTAAVVYGTRIGSATLTTLTGGLINSAVTTAVSGITNAALDSRTQYSYDNRGQLTREYNPLFVASPVAGNYVTLDYNAFGEVATVTSPTSNAATDVATTVYNRRGLRSYTNHLLNGSALGAVQETFAYDAFARVTSHQTNNREPLGETFAYDRASRVVGNTNNYGQAQTFAYDARSNLISTTDRIGKTTSFAWDLFTRTVTTTSAEGVVTTVKKNAYGQTILVTDGAGRATSYSYDQDGNLKTVTDAAGTTTNNYDNADRLIETIDAKGVSTRFTYDAASRVMTRVQDYGAGKLNLTTTFAYDAKGQQVSVTDALNVVTTYAFDLKGQATRIVTDAGTGKLNMTTDFIYGGDGKVIWQTDAVGAAAEHKTFFEYDSLGRLTRKTEDQGAGKLNVVTNFAYDVNGNLVATSDNLARVTRFAYDKENRLVATVNAEGEVTENGYDGEGRVIWTRQYLTKLDPATLSTFASFRAGRTGWCSPRPDRVSGSMSRPRTRRRASSPRSPRPPSHGRRQATGSIARSTTATAEWPTGSTPKASSSRTRTMAPTTSPGTGAMPRR
jgi:YD repeat-containing protein